LTVTVLVHNSEPSIYRQPSCKICVSECLECFWHFIFCLYVINSITWTWLLLCEVYKLTEREVHAKSVSGEVPEACTEKWIIFLCVLWS